MTEELSGGELETEGLRLFNDLLGLEAVRPTVKTVRLLDLDPGGPHRTGDSLELDYLIPRGEVCLIGEITARANATSIGAKFDRFRGQFELVSRKLTTGSRGDRRKALVALGVPADRLSEFLEVKACQAFYLQTQNSRSDYELKPVPGVIPMYSTDWAQLQEYAQALGGYARRPFLDRFGLMGGEGQQPIKIKPAAHNLHREEGRIIASDAGPADVFTFVANPYHLLPVARVFRRDELAPESERDQMYQRALRPDKLKRIRGILRANPKFMFPNGILLVLAADCEYVGGNLDIPDRYGSVVVIDGQHRLFSYADEEIEEICAGKAKIPVTAVLFDTEDAAAARRAAAATFVEINAHQTRIAKAHIDEIGYSILGKADPRSLAADALMRLNRRDGPFKNLLRTAFHKEGRIPLTTVTTALTRLTNLERLRAASRSRRGRQASRWQGLQRLLALTALDLDATETLVKKVEIALDRYTGQLRKRFRKDWDSIREGSGTTLGFAVVQAALIALFDQFVTEGLDWPDVESRLDSLRGFLDRKAGGNATGCLFRPEDGELPNQQKKVKENLTFLATHAASTGEGRIPAEG